MGGINFNRVLLGGLVAGLIAWLIEGASSAFYMADMETILKAHNLSMEMSVSMAITSAILSMIGGFVSIFFYAAASTRLGSGTKTALIIGSMMWLGGYLLSLIGFQMLGLFPNSMLAMWGAIGFVELNLATVVGAKLYKD
jgi:hypothetical protein